MTLADRIKQETQQAFSELVQNREKIETPALLPYRELTLDAVDLVTKDDGSVYCVVVFKEFPDNFYFGGKVLTDIAIAVYNATESETGTPVYLTEDVKVCASTQRSKNGRNYIKWEVL